MKKFLISGLKSITMIKRGKISIRKAGHRAVEMVQWPNSDPCHTSMRTCSGTLPMLGSQRKRRLLGTLLVHQFSWTGELQVKGDTLSQKQGGTQLRKTRSASGLQTYAHTFWCTNTYTNTYRRKDGQILFLFYITRMQQQQQQQYL